MGCKGIPCEYLYCKYIPLFIVQSVLKLKNKTEVTYLMFSTQNSFPAIMWFWDSFTSHTFNETCWYLKCILNIVNNEKMNTDHTLRMAQELLTYIKYIYVENSLLLRITLHIYQAWYTTYTFTHYVMQLVSELRQVSGFLLVLRLSPSIKLTATA
jgi:hypothetical protein